MDEELGASPAQLESDDKMEGESFTVGRILKEVNDLAESVVNLLIGLVKRDPTTDVELVHDGCRDVARLKFRDVKSLHGGDFPFECLEST